MRWHTEDVAVQRLAMRDSKIAFSISRLSCFPGRPDLPSTAYARQLLAGLLDLLAFESLLAEEGLGRLEHGVLADG
jgi:hypothetical protein